MLLPFFFLCSFFSFKVTSFVTSGTTLVSFSDKKLKDGGGKSKIEVASYVGEKLAELAKSKKITKAVFDKGSYKFHGRVKALADGLRRGGLKF